MHNEELSMDTTISHWINGKPQDGQSARFGSVFDPASGTEIARVPFASSAEVDRAVAAARAAFPAWRDKSLTRRTQILFRFRGLLEEAREELAAIVSRQHGKTLPDAQGEVQRGLEVVEFACGAPHLLKGENSQQVSTGVDL
ncbi:MAG: aldehyde dehydrogenase family protein, partial [Myxococcales bacterium]|nr:aldehyde dehydrogenase family protein [Myxococcales bacterium]